MDPPTLPNTVPNPQPDPENQFDEISAILGSEDLKSDTHNIGYIHHHSGLANQRREFQDKLHFYDTLLRQNRQMFHQLKNFDVELTQEVRNLSNKKQLKSSNPLKPRIRSERSHSLMKKYKELDTIRNELQIKRQQKASYQEIIQKVQALKAVYKEKYMELEMKRKTLVKLKGMADNRDEQASRVMNESAVQLDGYAVEIRELKQKLKEKTSQIYEEKERFINKFKSRSKIQANSTSTPKIPTQKSQNETQKLSPSTQKLKQNYETLGNRLQILRTHKKSLLETKNTENQRRKYLQKLKNKLIQLTKL